MIERLMTLNQNEASFLILMNNRHLCTEAEITPSHTLKRREQKENAPRLEGCSGELREFQLIL